MNSLGLNDSYVSEASTDVSDVENSPSPAFMRRFQKVQSSPLQQKNLFRAPLHQHNVTTNRTDSPTKRPVFSQFQIDKQSERSQAEQSKIDQMHAVFEKVGLMKSVA